ncbi:pilus assembly protein PilP [Undibacterium sp. SXout20W]|uniref:pilus assembly protein PilP n=1 Tax=Undibacterium sp. SXout20W TaxID=3413051 RepID=UPI003BF1FCAC
MMFNKLKFLLILLATSLLSACGDNGSSELTEWMANVKKETKLSIPKLTPPKVFVPVAYTGKDELDPFNSSKLLAVLARMKSDSTHGPDMDRRKEALEAFPLDSLKMVGTIEKSGLKQALVQADKTVYQARIGGYIGQNFGLITGIADDGVEIKETVQDAAGEWVERKVKLELQESQK